MATLADLLPYLYQRSGALQRNLFNLVHDPVGLLGQWGSQLGEDAGSALQQNSQGLLNMQSVMPGVQQMGLRDVMNTAGNAALMAHLVYHGSPHLFPPTADNPLGALDMSKVGSGEGKAQQGIGFYLADQKPVGQKYADKLAQRVGKDSGYLYSIELPDDAIGSMGLYDAPISQQPNGVKQTINGLVDEPVRDALQRYYGWENPSDAPLSAVMQAMEIANGNNAGAVTTAFKNAGIPGIRYLDAGSRGAGSGTYNTVLFDPTLAKIVGRE